MYPNIHCRTIYNSQGMKATYKSVDRGMDKDAVVHIYNGMLLSHKKNTFESVLMRWMNLERITQSEVSHKEKNKYRILMYIYIESKRMVLTNLFAEQQWRCKHRETDLWTSANRLMDKWGEEEKEGEINADSSMDAYTLRYVNRQPMGICCVT